MEYSYSKGVHTL